MSSTRLALRLRTPSFQKLQLARPPCPPAQAGKARCFAAPTASPTQPSISFTGSFPRHRPEGYEKDYKPPDERTLKLGKTLRTLQPLLPSLLVTPLPISILSPQITLHLFPSTHPHLPAVHGRVAYIAALWTSPLAWGRIPIIGNVRLEILTERMIKSPVSDADPSASGAGHEQLVVRWRTIGKPNIGGGAAGRAAKGFAERGTRTRLVETMGEEDEFTGLFIFEFDEEGRIVRHVIEHVQEGGNWERGVGARVVGLTDWLLGRMHKDSEEGEGAPAPCCVRC